MIETISLLGSSSGRNAGDAALISSIMDSIDEACGKRLLYEIPTIRPEFIWKNYENRVRPISMLPWDLSVKMLGVPTFRSILRTDLSLVFDAILFDRSLYNPLFNYLSTLAVLLPFAKRQGKKMGFYNVTAGPVTTPKGREMLLRLSEQMDFITVRDQTSYTILQELGVQNPNILVTADAALNTRPASSERIDQILTSLGLRDEGEVLAVNVNPYLDSWAGLSRAPMTREHFVATYSRALNRVAREIKVPLLFLSTQHLDVSLTKELMARVHEAPKKVLFSNTEYNHHEIKGVMGRMSLLSGMRLHAIILTSSAQTPVIGLNYLPKVDHYFRELGQQEFNMSFEHFNEENLVHHILKGWENRHALRATLQRRIPELQQEANKGAELVRALRQGETISPTIARLRSTAGSSQGGAAAAAVGL